jgi:hypothetical protein
VGTDGKKVEGMTGKVRIMALWEIVFDIGRDITIDNGVIASLITDCTEVEPTICLLEARQKVLSAKRFGTVFGKEIARQTRLGA